MSAFDQKRTLTRCRDGIPPTLLARAGEVIV